MGDILKGQADVTLANDYQHTFRNKSQQRKRHLHYGGSPKFLHERHLGGFINGISHVRTMIVM
jgi:hypothetical protein